MPVIGSPDGQVWNMILRQFAHIVPTDESIHQINTEKGYVIMKKVGIIGAGTMGQGIAKAFAQSGWTVALCDIKQEWADNGKAKIQKGYAKLVEKGKMDQAAADALLANVLVEEKSACADADLIIECVKEDMVTKKALLSELDAMCKEGTVFASNTSSLSITEMANGLNHPVIGMHFFNPVPSMKLVEIIRENFDLRPAGIIKMLDLRRPIYKQTAAYGHFGRTDVELPWEKVDKAEALKGYLA